MVFFPPFPPNLENRTFLRAVLHFFFPFHSPVLSFGRTLRISLFFGVRSYFFWAFFSLSPFARTEHRPVGLRSTGFLTNSARPPPSGCDIGKRIFTPLTKRLLFVALILSNSPHRGCCSPFPLSVKEISYDLLIFECRV